MTFNINAFLHSQPSKSHNGLKNFHGVEMLVLRNSVKIKQFCYFNNKYLRFLSTNNSVLLKTNNEVRFRKFVKPLSNQKLKPPTGNFVSHLFQNTVDKRIFEYPAVLREEDINTVLNHSSKVENFLNNNANGLLTEDILQKLKELELFGLSVPQKYGGAGYTETESTFLLECTGTSPTLGRFISYNENYGCKLLNLFGSEEQKEKYLPRLVEGKSFIAFACLENGPLVDISTFKGHAINDDERNCYILKGEKKWVHNADKADLFLVMLKLMQPVDEHSIRQKFCVFIVEKNTPGVTVQKLISPMAQEAKMFDVSFKNVCIAKENVLGSSDTSGLLALRTSLSHTNIADSALCLNLMKQILHTVIQFIQERNLSDASGNAFGLIQDNLASLIIHTYALESVVYFLTGRIDTYESLDLFNESVLAKVIAVESLQFAIQKYIDIVGRESLKKSGVLEEAIKAVQYYSVFDENIEYLKMIIGAEGLVSTAPKLKRTVSALRKPYNDHVEFFKNVFKSYKDSIFGSKNKHQFKMELHSSLSIAADTVERSWDNIQNAIRNFFIDYGGLALEKEHIIIKLVEKAAYVYAAIACLSRASFSICYDLENHKNEEVIAHAFACFADSKIEQLHSEETKHIRLMEFYKFIGKNTFNNKCYPVEHPLSRTY